ncbi:hypothetical protein DFH09DRAFT_1068620 [Mycena vulgaris]|nr:hypothetical protein DFH09DRAFT_1068620 [Mycena vulgaris]
MPPLEQLPELSNPEDEVRNIPTWFEDQYRMRNDAHMRIVADNGSPYKGYSMDGIQLGDLLGVAVTRLLEFSQPYPGDDRLPLASEDFNHRRSHVERSAGESYIVRDLYFFEDVVLPMDLRWPVGTRVIKHAP